MSEDKMDGILGGGQSPATLGTLFQYFQP